MTEYNYWYIMLIKLQLRWCFMWNSTTALDLNRTIFTNNNLFRCAHINCCIFIWIDKTVVLKFFVIWTIFSIFLDCFTIFRLSCSIPFRFVGWTSRNTSHIHDCFLTISIFISIALLSRFIWHYAYTVHLEYQIFSS